MEPPRDNISSGYYRYDWGVFRDTDGVPPETGAGIPLSGRRHANDRQGGGRFGRGIVGLAEGASGQGDGRFAGRDDLVPPSRAAARRRPGNVPRPDPADLENRTLLLAFLETEPQTAWPGFAADLDRALTESGLGRVIHAASFIPTVPGTDKYIDEL